MFCAQCGNQISENSMFCPKCGAAVKRRAATAAQPMGDKAAVTAQPVGDKAAAPAQPMGNKAAAVANPAGKKAKAAPAAKKGRKHYIALGAAALSIVAAAAVLFYLFFPLPTADLKNIGKDENLALVSAWRETKPGETDAYYMLINEDGDIVAELGNHTWWSYSGGYLRIVKKSLSGKVWRYGFVDSRGRKVIPCKYKYAGDFHEGLAAVEKGGNWGYIDKKGKMVIEPRYDTAGQFNNGMACVTYFYDDNTFYVNTEGKEIAQTMPGHYDEKRKYFERDYSAIGGGYENLTLYYGGRPFSEGRAAVSKKKVYGGRGEYGYIDEDGEEVIECQYAYVGDFHDGYAPVLEGEFESPYYINKFGEPLDLWYMDDGERRKLEISYSSTTGLRTTYGFSEGYAAIGGSYYAPDIAWLGLASLDGWGFIDTDGQLVIPLDYDEAKNFHEGLAAVKKNDKWGYVDKTGNVVIPCQYDAAGDFSRNRAAVVKDGQAYYIDQEGDIACRLPKDIGRLHYLYPFRNVDDSFEPEEYLDVLEFRIGRK